MLVICFSYMYICNRYLLPLRFVNFNSCRCRAYSIQYMINIVSEIRKVTGILRTSANNNWWPRFSNELTVTFCLFSISYLFSNRLWSFCNCIYIYMFNLCNLPWRFVISTPTGCECTRYHFMIKIGNDIQKVDGFLGNSSFHHHKKK